EAVRGEEVRQVTRASDAGHDEDVPRLQLKGVNRRLERAQDGEVSAPWAPCGLDLGLVRVHLELHFHATTSTILSAMSREANGSPLSICSSVAPMNWNPFVPGKARGLTPLSVI